jgi:hypothetical protein
MRRCVYICLLGILVAHNLACNNAGAPSKAMEIKPHFTYQVELARYEFGQPDQKGETDYDSFIKSFEEFPWNDQVEKANEIQKVSPTLTVNNNEKNEGLWVSAMGDSRAQVFLIGYIYPKQVKGFFGFGKPRSRKWMEIYLTDDRNVVKECFRDFFVGNVDGLRQRFSTLQKYDEMESQIQD